MKQVIFDTDYVTIWVYPQKRVIHHQFKKYTYGDKLREVLLKGLETLEKYKCYKWLSDDRVNSALPQIDKDWSIKTWGPMTAKAGWKHWALILPEKQIGKMYMRAVVEAYASLGVNVELFSNPEAGLAWLEKQ